MKHGALQVNLLAVSTS